MIQQNAMSGEWNDFENAWAADLGWAPGVWPDFLVMTGEMPGIIGGQVVRGPILYTRGSVMVYNGNAVAMFYVSERGATIRIWND